MTVLPAPLEGFVVDKAISAKLCSTIVNHATVVGFSDGSTPPMFAGQRERATFTCEPLAKCIWNVVGKRCRDHRHDADRPSHHMFVGPCAYVPSGMYTPVGINPLMGISKYKPGGRFGLHTDSCHAESDQWVGMHTVLLYLNDADGGETALYDDDSRHVYTVLPKTGRMLVFYHHTLHEGKAVVSGHKYVLRTEVMYRRALATTSEQS